jgi:glycosyltransferase involved in cell wall biosynthesis
VISTAFMQTIQLINDMSVIGGPAMMVPDLCNSLVDAGMDVQLYTVAHGPVDATGFRFRYCEFQGANYVRALSISGDLHRALREAAQQPIVMHCHSVWSMLCVYPSWVARNGPSRAVIAPHGTLAPFAFKWRWYRKAPFWYAFQKRALETCDCLHSTGAGEVRDFRALGLKQPIMNIPNPIVMPEVYRRPPDPSRRRRALCLGRLHPIKGLDTLLRCWRQVQSEFLDWELHLVGPEQPGYRAELEALAAELGCDRVEFRDGVRDAAKRETYDQADLFVLTSHSEGFGLVVAEALSHGLPAVVCKGAPWAGLEPNGCGWWVDHAEGPVTEALRAAMSMNDCELRAMGQRGREWVDRDFSSRRVAQLMGETYAWLLGNGPMPDCVIQ